MKSVPAIAVVVWLARRNRVPFLVLADIHAPSVVLAAMLVALVYIAVNVLIGSIIEPKYMGKGLGLSTLVVFISLVFWGWLFGSVGMLLSVPLTMAVKFAAMNNPQTRWFGILLSPAPEDDSSRPENGKAGPGHSS